MTLTHKLDLERVRVNHRAKLSRSNGISFCEHTHTHTHTANRLHYTAARAFSSNNNITFRRPRPTRAVTRNIVTSEAQNLTEN